jgi:hypothetical protein
VAFKDDLRRIVAHYHHRRFRDARVTAHDLDVDEQPGASPSPSASRR